MAPADTGLRDGQLRPPLDALRRVWEDRGSGDLAIPCVVTSPASEGERVRPRKMRFVDLSVDKATPALCREGAQPELSPRVPFRVS
jgi:hypothetical protein